MIFVTASQFYVYLPCLGGISHIQLGKGPSMTFSVILKLSRTFVWSSLGIRYILRAACGHLNSWMSPEAVHEPGRSGRGMIYLKQISWADNKTRFEEMLKNISISMCRNEKIDTFGTLWSSRCMDTMDIIFRWHGAGQRVESVESSNMGTVTLNCAKLCEHKLNIDIQMKIGIL